MAQLHFQQISLYLRKHKKVDKVLKYKNAEIHYTITGKGKAVVFLHGFLENSTMWDYFANYLSNSNTVICPDLPGFGKSDCISDNHSMELIADVVAAILDKENIEKAIIAGHSMGGYASLAIAENYPQLLDGLIMFHSHANDDSAVVKKNRDRTVEIVKKNHGDYISAFIPALFTDENRIKFKDEISMIVRDSLNTKNEGIIAAQAGMRDRPNRCHVLADIKVPVLFIVGKHDSRIPLEVSKEQIFLPAISESLILENAGHMGFIESRDSTLKIVESFINRHSN